MKKNFLLPVVLFMADAVARAKSLAKVDKKTLDELRGAQFVPQEKVWAMDEALLAVPAGQWTLDTKHIEKGNWDAHEAHFSVKGEEFKFRFRAGEEPDEDNDIVIARFVAERDYTTSSGKLIKKDSKAYFVVNQ